MASKLLTHVVEHRAYIATSAMLFTVHEITCHPSTSRTLQRSRRPRTPVGRVWNASFSVVLPLCCLPFPCQELRKHSRRNDRRHPEAALAAPSGQACCGLCAREPTPPWSSCDFAGDKLGTMAIGEVLRSGVLARDRAFQML